MIAQKFFEAMELLGLALSYDDVRLRTGYSEVEPALVDIASMFSRRVPLKLPIVSASMDTVTGGEMAIAMAKAGGIGVVHRNMTIEAQVKQIVRVKLHLNGLIDEPLTVQGDQTMEGILEWLNRKKHRFHSLPVTDSENRIIGILTKNDFDMCDNLRCKAEEVMTRELVKAEPCTDLETAYKIMKEKKKKVLPLFGEDRKIKGMYVFSDVKRMRTGNQNGFNTDENGHLRVAAAIGTGDEEYERALRLAEAKVDVILIDTAHGDSKRVIDVLHRLKRDSKLTKIDIVVGNVSEGDSAKRLVDAGADGIRVGQGPGSICTTRIIAGVGCPQVTAVHQCAQAILGSGVPVNADGGIKHSGDIPIAIAASAHSVTLGSLLAGTDESPGEVENYSGIPHKVYRGMGSLGAMQSSEAARNRYQERGTEKDRLVPEGIEGMVPYKGPVASVLHQYAEGLRRGMGYVGAATIEEMRTKARFLRMTAAGLRESHPHDVRITKNAPNYSGKES